MKDATYATLYNIHGCQIRYSLFFIECEFNNDFGGQQSVHQVNFFCFCLWNKIRFSVWTEFVCSTLMQSLKGDELYFFHFPYFQFPLAYIVSSTSTYWNKH